MFRTVLTVLLMTAAAARAEGEESPIDFIQKHTAEYILSLQNVEFVYKDRDFSSDGQSVYESENYFVSIEGHWKVHSKSSTVHNGKSPIVKNEWNILRPDGFYSIVDKGNGHFVLHSQQSNARSLLDIEPAFPLQAVMKPVSRNLFPISKLLLGQIHSHHVTVAGFRSAKAGDEVGFELSTTDATGGSIADTKYSLSQEGLIQSMEILSRSKGGRVVMKIDYTMFNNSHVPERVAVSRFQKGVPISPEYIATFRDYRRHSGSRSEFSLSQFGLPEPVGSDMPTRSPVYIWFIAAAAVLSVIAVVFRWMATRHTNRGTQPT